MPAISCRATVGLPENIEKVGLKDGVDGWFRQFPPLPEFAFGDVWSKNVHLQLIK
jgi:hypothetical protein